ncbi:MAG TPA: hypothetical protein VIG90_15250 [Pedomonas sp.]|uniref:hypothetical protein n=1 Tax=Pedomonas sp. TaxID=2976421 RepID=UPI002F3F6AE3
MIIGSDLSWLNSAPKPGDSRILPERSAAARSEAAAAVPAEAQAAVAQSQRVGANQTVRSQNAVSPRSPSEQDADARRFAREAPNGERPRFIAKGQMLNVLV